MPVVRRRRAVAAAEAPLPAEERRLIDVGKEFRQRQPAHHARPPEGRRGDALGGRDGARCGRRGAALGRRALGHDLVRRRLSLGEGVHDPQALEGVLPVPDPPGKALAQVRFHVAARQRRAAQQDRPAIRQVAAVQLLQILAHHQR